MEIRCIPKFLSPTSSPNDLSIRIAAGFRLWTLRTPSIVAIFSADRYIVTSFLTDGSIRSNGSKRSRIKKTNKRSKHDCLLPKRLERLERLELLERLNSHLVKTARRSQPALPVFRAEYDVPRPRQGQSSRWEKAALDGRAPTS